MDRLLWNYSENERLENDFSGVVAFLEEKVHRLACGSSPYSGLNTMAFESDGINWELI